MESIRGPGVEEVDFRRTSVEVRSPQKRPAAVGGAGWEKWVLAPSLSRSRVRGAATLTRHDWRPEIKEPPDERQADAADGEQNRDGFSSSHAEFMGNALLPALQSSFFPER